MYINKVWSLFYSNVCLDYLKRMASTCRCSFLMKDNVYVIAHQLNLLILPCNKKNPQSFQLFLTVEIFHT